MTCMSEEQRYSKEGRAGWDPSVGQGNKGEKRQNQWTSNLRKILAEATDLDSDVRNILDTIQEHENIPRKKPKFVNFVKNIMRNRARPHSIGKTWELFEQALKPAEPTPPPEPMDTKETEVNGNKEEVENSGEDSNRNKKSKKNKKHKSEINSEETNGKEETSEKENEEKLSKKKKKKRDKEDAKNGEHNNGLIENMDVEGSTNEGEKGKKRKREIIESEETEDSQSSSPKKAKFDWDEIITACLKRKEGNEMKLVKLKKKCVSEFFAMNEGTHKTQEEVGAKFDKKLKKRKYRLLKDKVKLILEDEPEEKIISEKPEPVIKKETKPAMSFNQWESSNLGSAAQTEKFRRLMGIKSGPAQQQTQPGKFGVGQRDDRKIFRDLEQGFEKARQAHFGGRCFEQ